jgi:hypothetical protein
MVEPIARRTTIGRDLRLTWIAGWAARSITSEASASSSSWSKSVSGMASRTMREHRSQSSRQSYGRAAQLKKSINPGQGKSGCQLVELRHSKDCRGYKQASKP